MQQTRPMLQMVSLTFPDGSTIEAPVDLWVASMLEVMDEEQREAVIARASEHIAAIQARQIQPQPTLIVPGRG